MELVISTDNTKNKMVAKKHWFPNRFIFQNHQNLNDLEVCNDKQQENMAILILNRPISLNQDVVIKLWNNAVIRILVDGGANRWLQFLDNFTVQNGESSKTQETIKLPDFVTGDFDSITEKTMNRLEKTMPSTKMIKTPNQDFTDFTKALIELRPHITDNENNIKSILAVVDSSGRIDHIMANINTMYHAKEIMPVDVDLFCICKNSISWLISAGEHIIHIPKKCVEKQLWCSYVPVGAKCTVTTTGFKWNLVNSVVEFGALISTSNTYVDETVTINCDGILYWSMGIDIDADDNDTKSFVL